MRLILALVLSTLLLVVGASAGTPGGRFDIGCEYSHSLPDDPIMHPGMPGMSHLHDFFGFERTDAFSTPEQMLADLTEDRSLTTCTERNDPEEFPAFNASGYWTPAVYLNGERLLPNHVHIYYRNNGGGPVEPFPLGFKVIVGDPLNPPEEQRGFIRWFCGNPGAGRIDQIPEDCAGQQGIKAEAKTPACWNGELDSFDHRSHVRQTPCGPDYPRRLPSLTLHFAYNVQGQFGRRIDPSTDEITLASGPMHTFHADYLSAWNPDRLAFLVDFCLNQHQDCKRNPPE